MDKMIGITNETITIPFIQICTPYGFYAGFGWAVISVMIGYLVFNYIVVWRLE